MPIRNVIIILFLVAHFELIAQITFDGNSENVRVVNSEYGEHLLYFSSDETLYLSRKQHPDNVGLNSDQGDIWYLEDDSIMQSDFNTKHFESPIGYSADQQYFLFNQVIFEKGTYTGRILYRDKSGNTEVLPIPFFTSKAPIQTGSINGKYLLLSLENSKGYGVDDIFVCLLDDDGNWSSPKNLGRTINTGLQEMTPFLASDQKTLFFASNGHGGEGSFDIFVSTRLDDTWINWTKPKNLGLAINTSGAETSFIIHQDGSLAYFASTIDSDGYADVKKIRIASEIESVNDEVIAMTIPKNDPSTLNITLRDAKTQLPISGMAIMLNRGDTIQSGADYAINIQSAEVGAEIELKSTDYLSERIEISLDDLQESTPLVISMEPLNEGNLITLKNVLFYRGTANFVEGSEKELDLVVEMLEENEAVSIELRGHTDNVGNALLNLQLSRERVLAVEEYLISQGVDSSRISGEGYGGKQPIASNDQEETRKLNRRVEFEIKRD